MKKINISTDLKNISSWSKSFIEKNKENIDWDLVLCCYLLPIEEIKPYRTYLDWDCIERMTTVEECSKLYKQIYEEGEGEEIFNNV